jgi:RNA polymerase sigma factor (TIGR02999 family)
MRRLLIDHARAKRSRKRGGLKVSLNAAGLESVQRDEDLIALDEALQRLEALDARASRVVELRFFAGLKEDEAAEVLGISPATLRRDWKFARSWLMSRFRGDRAIADC